jgi:hypothetical protein
MNVDTLVFRIAGIMVTVGVVLAYTHHIAWLALPLFAGLNMFQASFTGFCPLASIAKRFGMECGNAF